MEEEQVEEVKRRQWPRRLRLALATLLALLVVALLILWVMRVRIAGDLIDRELADRGVQASYDVKRIGFGTQIFENLVIGDPRRPDLVARRVEVQILLGFTGPRVGLITARGVRLRGRITGGRLRLGQVDRLLPPPSGLPFRLPDQRVDLADAAIGLETPAGRVALALSGRGNLSDGFRGRMAMVSAGLALGECRVAAPVARVAVSVDDLEPRFRGPLAMGSVRCGDDLAVERPRLALDATFAPGMDSWRGNAGARAARLQAGPHVLAGPEGRFSFAGNQRDTRGTVDLRAAQAAVDVFRAAGTRFAGRYALSPRHGDLSLGGALAVRGLIVRESALGSIAGALRSANGTPLSPVGNALAAALVRAGRGGAEVRADLALANGRGEGGVRFARMSLAGRSGVRLRAVGGEGLTYYWPSGEVRLDGDFALSGGGFPDARFALVQPRGGGALRGVGRIAPITAGGARLALGELRFTAAAGGRTTFETHVLIDGPLGGGRVAGLSLPIAGRFGRDGFALGESCVAASFRALQLAGLRLGPTRLPLCPVGRALVWQGPSGALQGGAEIRSPRFAGRLGQSPVAFAADRLRVDLAGFTASNLAVRLGAAPATNRFDAASLSGRFSAGGVAGDYAGLSGDLANVPLLVSEGTGTWQLRGGELGAHGRVQVSDKQDPARFRPLVSEDFRLTLADNRIRAGGWLSHPASGTRVTEAAIEHDLASGAGHALLDVPGLRFTPDFQPEALTPLTIGVVALVDGSVSGRGRIEWDAQGSRSSGTFGTADLDLAAPFGPVEGLATNIEFTDLLGLTSAPGQVARIGLVRAGVDVYDGVVTYQLRPNYHVAVESGRWPFAGGELFLQPTILDFSRESTKYLTFRVAGLDAALFVQQLEFSNISATGTFDGVVPMQFGQGGARIVAGRLAAREEGGTLSYIGELTDADLGVYGKMAFDALKSLRYSRFDITLDGSLDGEFLSNIDLDGIARDLSATRAPSGGGIQELIAGRALSQLARIPFEFNIRIEGPFRALLATARSFEDPTPLIQALLPQLLRDRPATITDVQDEESETVQ